MRITILTVLFLMTAPQFATGQMLSPKPQLTPVPDGVEFDFERWPYPLYDEIVERLKMLASRYPKLAELHNIGQSGAGRDLWVIEITNKATGPGDDKPALWIDGNMHQAELTTRRIPHYFIERLLASYGKDPVTTNLVDTRTFYIMPILDVEGGDRMMSRHPAWPGHRPDQHDGQDLDGDGFITQMRVKDPNGNFYASPIDQRLMLEVRNKSGGRWNYISTSYEEDYYWRTSAPITGWIPRTDRSEMFDDPGVPPDQRYSIYTEGQSFEEPEVNVLREEGNFNRNWSSDWRASERGAGAYPFSVPEIRAVAEFTTRTHRNIFFYYNAHSGGAPRNYIVRPPMNKPYTDMLQEDNDFYRRIGFIYGAISGGNIIHNNYDNPSLMTGVYGDTWHGFVTDWAYEDAGFHVVTPELEARQKDYNGDGYVTWYEILRWNDEEMDGKYYKDWTSFDHPVLGEVEIGGEKGMPPGYGEQLETVLRIQYDWLMHVAGLSPLLRIKALQSERLSNRRYRITATLQNEGFLSTYVARNALKIRRDYPIVATLSVTGGSLVQGDRASKNAGHILGTLAYVARWGKGADESTTTVEWMVSPEGRGPVTISVEAWAYKAGRDESSITISR